MRLRCQSLRLGSCSRLWLPALVIALGCVLIFGVLLVSTTVGQHTLSTLRFAFGWQHIAKQQQQLHQAVEAAFHAAGLSVAVHRHEVAIPQRRGQEYWQHQTHTIPVSPRVSLDRYAAVLQNTTHQLHHTILRHQKWQNATHVKVALTIGMAGVPTDTFILIQPRSPSPAPASRAQIAIVIDDLGWDLEAARELLNLEVPISFAILPNAPYRMLIAQEAQRRGYDVLLHLPMEPHRYPDVNPGQPVLLSTMKPKQLVTQLATALEALPAAVGVNNHMGSRLTENRKIMRTIMQQMKHRNLFFLDSRTTKHSLAYQVAREMGVRTAERHVFLDSEGDLTKIHRQLRYLVTLAHSYGAAVGIGHPYPQTLRALQEALPELHQDGVEVVPVSRLVR